MKKNIRPENTRDYNEYMRNSNIPPTCNNSQYADKTPSKAYVFSHISDRIPIGKHKHSNIMAIIRIDPDYIKYMIEKGIFKLSDELYNELIKYLNLNK